MAKNDPVNDRIKHWARLKQFATDEVYALATKAAEKLKARHDFKNKDGQFILDSEKLDQELLEAACIFLEYKTAAKLALAELDIKPVENAITSARDLLEQLDAIKAPWINKINRNEYTLAIVKQFLEGVIFDLGRLLPKQKLPTKRSGPRLSPALPATAARLIKAWPIVSGSKFKRTFTGSQDKLKMHFFVSLAPLFVQLTLQAFDESVTFSSVKTALEKLQKGAAPRRKNL